MKFITPDWPAPKNIHAFTTTRQGWSDTSNRNVVAQLLKLPNQPVWLKQTHGTQVIDAGMQHGNNLPNADASFTTSPHCVCVVLTADCLPLLITNQQGSYVAAIHAGWRGLANGIIEETFKTIQQPTSDMLVWLGPAIGPQKFEVGKDVFDAFVDKHQEAEAAFLPTVAGKWHADLYTLAKQRLNALGVHHIYGGNFCTLSQPDLFHSYRRDKESSGRMASLIWID